MSFDGRIIAISISDAPDRDRLGYPSQEVDRVLLSVCTALVRAGARIVYGGNLDPTGFTFKIFRHLAQAYAVQGPQPPFIHVVPEPVLRRANFEDLGAVLREARGTVETKVAWADGRLSKLIPEDNPEGDEPTDSDGSVRPKLIPIRVVDEGSNTSQIVADSGETLQNWFGPERASPADAFSQARRTMTRISAGRVAMGGRMGLKDRPDDQYQGKMPGVIEEAILALAANQPLVTLGAFGGASRDLAIALNLLDEGARVPRGEQDLTYSKSLDEAKALAGRIPEPLRRALSHIAADDRAEPLSYGIIRVLEAWPR